MKLALLGLCVLPLAALRPAQPAEAPLDDPMPIECPMCGGNTAMHMQLVTWITLTQAQAAQLALTSGWS